MESQAIIEAVASHCQATGYFDKVNQHEPKVPPGNELSAAVWVQSLRPEAAASGLAATTTRLVLGVRIYSNMFGDPQDMIDPKMMEAVDAVLAKITGDFQLDGLVRNVDLLGSNGEGLGGEAGYVTINNTMYRVFTILVPVLVNDVWNQVA